MEKLKNKSQKLHFEPSRKRIINYYLRLLIKISWSAILGLYFIYLTIRIFDKVIYLPVIGIITILFFVDVLMNIINEKYLILKLECDHENHVFKINYLEYNVKNQVKLDISNVKIKLNKYRFGRGASPNYGLSILSKSTLILIQRGNMAWKKDDIKQMFESLEAYQKDNINNTSD